MNRRARAGLSGPSRPSAARNNFAITALATNRWPCRRGTTGELDMFRNSPLHTIEIIRLTPNRGVRGVNLGSTSHMRVCVRAHHVQYTKLTPLTPL